jgi:nucleolar protein 58
LGLKGLVVVCFASELGHGGVILVLFETPSGFAIFAYDGVKLYKSDVHEVLV